MSERSPSPLPFFRLLRAGRWLVLVLLACPLPVRADMRGDIGWTALRQELGASMPNGSDVSVLQVEATATSPVITYLPQAGASSPFAGSGDYAGKTFTALSGTGAQSWHANLVAGSIYGNAAGIAPGVTTVHCMYVGTGDGSYFLDSLWSNNLATATTAAVQNHSWVSEDSYGTTQANNDLRDYDKYLEDNGLLAACGLANNDTPDVAGIPYLMASGFHGLAVGRTDGQHKTGTTAAGLDAPGRMKPDLVAPSWATSWTTGVVSGAIALNWQALGTFSPSTTGAARAHAVKSVLLAGADKSPFPRWQRAATANPYDATFGAGEVDVGQAYHILAGGKQSADLTTILPRKGWNAETAPSGDDERTYRFAIASGRYATVSVALTWPRKSTGDQLADNLDLELRRLASGSTVVELSNSAVDNVEHVFRRHLPAGTYEIAVTGLNDNAYAVAWEAEESGGPVLTAKRPTPATRQLLAANLDPLVTYTVEQSTTLTAGSWSTVTTFRTADDTTPAYQKTISIPATAPAIFYRLRWTAP